MIDIVELLPILVIVAMAVFSNYQKKKRDNQPSNSGDMLDDQEFEEVEKPIRPSQRSRRVPMGKHMPGQVVIRPTQVKPQQTFSDDPYDFGEPSGEPTTRVENEPQREVEMNDPYEMFKKLLEQQNQQIQQEQRQREQEEQKRREAREALARKELELKQAKIQKAKALTVDSNKEKSGLDAKRNSTTKTIVGDVDWQKAILYSEILKPKFNDYDNY